MLRYFGGNGLGMLLQGLRHSCFLLLQKLVQTLDLKLKSRSLEAVLEGYLLYLLIRFEGPLEPTNDLGVQRAPAGFRYRLEFIPHPIWEANDVFIGMT